MEQSGQLRAGTECVEDASLNLQVLPRSKGPDIVDALVGRSADFGTLANTPIVFQALQGTRLVVFATIMSSAEDIKVVSYRSAGIERGGDLAGKRVGYVGGTFGEIFLDRYLEKHGVTKDTLILTSAGPAQLRDLFIAKELDSIVIWEPAVQDILAEPDLPIEDIYVDVDDTLYTGRIHLVANPDTLVERRKEARGLLKALLCGEDLLREHPEEARALLERWLERQPGTLEKVFQPSAFRVGLNSPQVVSELITEAVWAKSAVFSGRASIPESFGPWIDSSILKEVAPERIE